MNETTEDEASRPRLDTTKKTKRKLAVVGAAVSLGGLGAFGAFMACVGAAAGAVSFATVLYIVAGPAHIFSVTCPVFYGRTCNNHGTCDNGACTCELLYSGEACADNQIAGYSPETNSECSGNGFAYTFPLVADVCSVSWRAENCTTFVRLIREEQRLLQGSGQQVAAAVAIPNCVCNPGWGGVDCRISPCPTDENGLICGGNGNTSVGLFSNRTQDGTGCQCQQVLRFDQSPVYDYFTEAQKEQVNGVFYNQYHQTYCGDASLVTFTDGTIPTATPTAPPQVTTQHPTVPTSSPAALPTSMPTYYRQSILTNTDTGYRCLCDEDWGGAVCTLNNCERGPDGRICWGNGSPLYGQGLLTNTTLTTRRGVRCTPNCVDGTYDVGNGRCLTEQDESTPLFDPTILASYGSQCTDQYPLRCYDGTCVPVPINNRGCLVNDLPGVYDWSQLSNLTDALSCRITEAASFIDCFDNATAADLVVSYRESGGIVWNATFELTFDLGSPLIYFQFSTNGTNATVSTWDGQYLINDVDGLMSGAFQYESVAQSSWLTDIEDGEVEVLLIPNVGYSIGPITGYNYSGAVSVPVNYTTVRVSSADKGFWAIFTIDATSIRLRQQIDDDYILIRTTGDNEWFSTQTGLPITSALALSSPANFSWIVWDDQVRNLDSTFYLCVSASLPIIQTTACGTVYSAYYATLADYLVAWDTLLVGNPTFAIPVADETFSTLERNFTRTSFPVTISFPSTGLVEIVNPVFLTSRNVQVNCACPQSQLDANDTVLNEIWYAEGVLREVRSDIIDIGDYALTARYDRGVRELIRGKVSGVTDGQTLVLYNVWRNITFTSFFSQSRTITVPEVLDGFPVRDGQQFPMICPDGRASQLVAVERDVPVTCNATYIPPVMNVTCLDSTNATFGCRCIPGELCLCDLPALSDFANDMLAEVDELVGDDCQCLIYANEDTDNTSVLVYGPAETITFGVNMSQTINYIVLMISGVSCLTVPDIQITGLNQVLFSNVTIDITNEIGLNTACEIHLTPFYPAYAAVNEVVITVSYASSVIEWGSLVFSTQGFEITSLFDQDDITFFASSNEADAPNILFNNTATYWVSEDNELPVYIGLTLPTHLYVNRMSIVFYQSGVLTESNVTVPFRIYVQGYNDGGWYTLGSVGVYVEAGGWAERSLTFDTVQAYSQYRLVCLDGAFGIRTWNIITDQYCTCTGGEILSLQLTSIAGLPTVQSILDQIAAIDSNLMGAGCQCVNNCTVDIGNGELKNVSSDGICSDAIYVSAVLGITPELRLFSSTLENQTEIVLNDTSPLRLEYKEYTYGVFTGIDSIQFATDASLFVNVTLQEFYYTQSAELGNPFVQFDPTTQDFPLQTLFFLNASTLEVIFPAPATDPYTIQYYVNDTFFMLVEEWGTYYGGIVELNQACCAGCDCSDCGSNSRLNPVPNPSITCVYSPAQAQLLVLIANTSVVVNQTYFVANLSSLSSWQATYQNIIMTRNQPVIGLANCPGQTCNVTHPYLCDNGACVEYYSDCENRYTCPANGCVKQTDAAAQGFTAFRCACQVGYGGDACQYGPTRAATPRLQITQQGAVPGALEATCGGPPQLRQKPPVVNEGIRVTENVLNRMNWKWTADSPQVCENELGYLRVMPSQGWGQALRYEFVLNLAPLDILSEENQLIYTTCPPMRMGFHGEYILLSDDLVSVDPATCLPTWKVWTAPNDTTYTFPWTSITTYNQFPWRCANGQCVPDESYCSQSVALFPLCNDRGECRADGTCQCFSGWKTFIVNQRITDSAIYPYFSSDGVPNPTVWELNDNWRRYGLNWCAARDCSNNNCQPPIACFPGTSEKDFTDALVLCDATTGRGNRCAPSQGDCAAGVGIQYPLVCGGNGIPKVKDFTGEYYCHCGKPISPLANITYVTQITDLEPNGWGGVDCAQYEAPPAVLVYSTWNFLLDEAYNSSITNEQLPGVWLQGVAPVGPDPDQRLEWDACCQGYDRLELCPNVVCLVQSKLTCMPATQCLPPNTPQIFACNNHGTARADGTCECDSSLGSGYTNDFTQFSIDGCYRQFTCPVSSITGVACNYVEACDKPEEWRYPAPDDMYLKQQAWMCGTRIGLISNATLLNEIQVGQNLFEEFLLDALAVIAISVRDEITALAGCICVYPDDTTLDRYGMLTGGNYPYAETYQYSFLLPGDFTDRPYLTNYDRLYAYGHESYALVSGDVLTFTLTYNRTTSLSAVRIFGNVTGNRNLSSFTVADGAGVKICTDIQIQNQTLPGQLEWMVGIAGASYCIPEYVCETFATNTDYSSFCSDPTSISCQSWREGLCDAGSPTLTPWPVGSGSVYGGCERGVNEPLCTCCRRLDTPYPDITDGVINITYIGPGARIGTVQLYGNTEEALPAGSGLTQNIQQLTGRDTECVDYLFVSSALNANRNLHTNLQNASREINDLTFNQSQATCRLSDSYLALPESAATAAAIASNLSGLVDTFKSVCNSIDGEQGECWVGGRDTVLFDDFATRAEILDQESDENCTLCYEPIPVGGGKWGLSFSTYPLAPTNVLSTKFKVAEFTDQISGSDVLTSMFTTNDFVALERIYYSPLGSDISDCTIRYHYVSNGYPILSVYLLFRFERDDFPAATSVTLLELDDNVEYTLYLKSGFPFRYGTMFSLSDFDSASAGALSALATLISRNAQMESIFMSPSTCGTVAFYDQATCTDPRSRNFETSTHTRTPRIGNPPYYIVQSQCLISGSFILSATYGSFTDRANFIRDCPGGGADDMGHPYRNVLIIQRCWRLFPTYNFFELDISASKNRFFNGGSFGNDFAPGLQQFPYMPVFFRITVRTAIGWVIGPSFREGEVVQSDEEPVYFVSNPEDGYTQITNTYVVWPSLPTCRSCIAQLPGTFAWNTQLFYERGITWPNRIDDPPDVELYIRHRPTNTFLRFIELYDNTATVASFVHLTTYLESRVKQAAAPARVASEQFQWYLSTCLAVNSTDYITRPCQLWTANYICQWDYLKAVVVTGQQCDRCGPSTRPGGGTPVPGETCFTEHEFANATLYPQQHLIYDNYLANTLDLYADSISPPDDVDLVRNRSLIWAIPDIYRNWTANRSTRGPQSGGQTSVGVTQEQNWCDMSLSVNWPNDCEQLGFSIRDPITNNVKRVCAADPSYCILSTPTGPNPVMQARYIPPLYNPVTAGLVQTNPTCGYPVPLRSYFEMDKWGAPQSQLSVNNTLLQPTSTYVQIQIISQPSVIFNGGKTPTQYRFEWYNLASVTTQINLVSCPGCTFPITVDVFIHPISPSYEYPTTRITQTVSIEGLGLTTMVADFTVSPSDTGVVTRNGYSFPIVAFRGLAFDFSAFPVLSSFYLFNPIIVDNATAAQCQTREVPVLVEPRPRIESTAPYRPCIYNAALQSLYPGSELGDCGCDVSSAGRSCDCPAVTSKYGKEVCGGYGDEGKRVQGPDGQLSVTGEGTEAGCYIYGAGPQSACKTIDLGTVLFTTLVPTAVWNYPSVFVDSPPIQGESIFFTIQTPQSEPVTFDGARWACGNESAFLPFYYSSDELTQFIRTQTPPVVMSINHTTDDESWPWLSNIDGAYFTRADAGTLVAPAMGDFDCVTDADVCTAVNFNNLAYAATTSDVSCDCKVDGNTVTACAGNPCDITYSADASLIVDVYLFGTVPTGIECVDTTTGDCPGTFPEYTCRCPSRILRITGSAGVTEVQIFNQGDGIRTSTYY